MRLVAWNSNHNARRRSLDENIALLEPFDADILVVSETAGPRFGTARDRHWIGNSDPGLAVVAPKGLTLAPHPANSDAETLMGAFVVRGYVNFNLLAVWPVVTRGITSYHNVLMAAFDRYAEFLACDPVIMAGDLNSSTRVFAQKVTHPQFVEHAERLGLVSAYHAQTGEKHGEETIATYLHGSGTTREFHIDYCFAGKSLKECATISVENNATWAARSDHFPLVLDVPNAALKPIAD